ncbi:trehalose-phosphatase [Bartonella sp. TP]|uniref:trehalose-phosphatase n=1 Tax=Bartonella sp. TP TaxID=3057550 RepID=UPI0025B1F4E2|nr:trehalose-phosphatase [Bartonella sp. TP]MDN5248573.1 trehalose-phosphatase [Alphaproteobacteria bacterium]WJW80385.1 trehalose-phosphatase [Bartonella sp. TP]
MDRLQNINLDETAFFFDFDGTLVDICPKPQEIVIANDLPNILAIINEKTHNAMAIISGRKTEEIEQLLKIPLNIAGIHGAVIKNINGELITASESADFAEARQYMKSHAEEQSLLYIEDKGLSIAIHYRNKDSYMNIKLKKQAYDLALSALELCKDNYELQFGKLVIELKPKGQNKGTALDYFMNQPNFKNRLPLCFGDDITDYSMFAAAKKYNGFAYKIEENTKSNENKGWANIATPKQLRNILQQMIELNK